VSHALLLQGMIGLLIVDLWIVTAQFNPLLRGLVVPLGPLEPLKVLANLAGLAVLGGTLWLWRERLRRPSGAGPGTFADHALLGLLAAAVLSGFGAELLHFARQDELRTAAYLLHLTTVLTLFLVLPFSKAAHPVYRLAALAFVERRGGRLRRSRGSAGAEANP
jgi:quinone-modifying oxidoreductase subunit QmoC